MPRRKPSDAVDIADLHRGTAWRLLRDVILPRHRVRLGRHPDVHGVEIGVKESGDAFDSDAPPCLKIYVYRKGDPAQDRELPNWVTATAPDGRRVAARTDVEQLGDVTLEQFNLVAAPDVSVPPRPPMGGERGSMNGLLIGAPATSPFVLTAGHLFDGRPDNETVTWRVAGAGPPGRGAFRQRSQWPQLPDDNGVWGFVDAGLAEVQQPGPLVNPATFPWGGSVATWNQAPVFRDVVICTRGGLRQAAFAARVPVGLPVPTPHGPIPYWRLLRYRLLDGPTVPGDSGSPAIALQSGRLLGMHVLHDRAMQPDGSIRECSLCLSAGDLLDIYRNLLANPTLEFSP